MVNASTPTSSSPPTAFLPRSARNSTAPNRPATPATAAGAESCARRTCCPKARRFWPRELAASSESGPAASDNSTGSSPATRLRAPPPKIRNALLRLDTECRRAHTRNHRSHSARSNPATRYLRPSTAPPLGQGTGHPPRRCRARHHAESRPGTCMALEDAVVLAHCLRTI
jgi:hypothetical protein